MGTRRPGLRRPPREGHVRCTPPFHRGLHAHVPGRPRRAGVERCPYTGAGRGGKSCKFNWLIGFTPFFLRWQKSLEWLLEAVFRGGLGDLGGQGKSERGRSSPFPATFATVVFFPGVRRRVLEQVAVRSAFGRGSSTGPCCRSRSRTATVRADAPSAVRYHVHRGRRVRPADCVPGRTRVPIGTGRIPRPGFRTMSASNYGRRPANLAPGLVDSCPIPGARRDEVRWSPGGSFGGGATLLP